MKRIILLAIAAFAGISSSCNGQQQPDGKQQKAETIDPANPQTKINVNREYDENGNLIRFDSAYSYYYSTNGTNLAKMDSIFDAFQQQFHTSFPFSAQPFFDELFFTDSLLHYDFYKNNFFSKRFWQNQQRIQDYFEQMDSLKNKFFQNQVPNRTYN